VNGPDNAVARSNTDSMETLLSHESVK
jgi:hypothetical protein